MRSPSLMAATLVLAGACVARHELAITQPAGTSLGMAFEHFAPLSNEPVHKGGVDISTGLYTRTDEDLIVDDDVPLVLRRTYLSGDRQSRQFGVGGTHPGEWYLIGDSVAFTWAELILADGGRIRFDRVDSPADAPRLVHSTPPTVFFQSTLEQAGPDWALRFTDGSAALIRRCSVAKTKTCALVELNDREGHRIRYVRDPTNLLVQIQGPTRQIALEYDDHRRIVSASDSSTQSVVYRYDERGRLIRVVESTGTVRRYEYSELDEMTSIVEPGWIINNTFDESGRLVRQITRLSDDDEPIVFEFDYTVVDGSVLQTDMIRNGERTRFTFNRSHYELTKTIDADGPNPIFVEFERDAATNVLTGLTLRCTGLAGPVVRTAEATQQSKDAIVRGLIGRECR